MLCLIVLQSYGDNFALLLPTLSAKSFFKGALNFPPSQKERVALFSSSSDNKVNALNVVGNHKVNVI